MADAAATGLATFHEGETEGFCVARIEAARRCDSPFPHWRLDRLLPEPIARALAALPFAPTELGGVSGRRELHNAQRNYFAGGTLGDHAVCEQVAALFRSPLVLQAIMALTGISLAGTFLRIEYAVDVDGFWLEPHTDLGVKVFTLLYQMASGLGQSDLGTDLYHDASSWAVREPFLWNSGLAFVPSDRTWHGFEQRPIHGLRRSMIVNYVTADWRAREQLVDAVHPVMPFPGGEADVSDTSRQDGRAS